MNSFSYNLSMSDSFLDHLPSREREKIRKRLRSPEAYERLREKVKGPEDLEREMERSEKLAELHLALESDPQFKETLKQSIETDIKEQGIDAVLESMNEDLQKDLEAGKFSVAIESHPETHEDSLVVIPEGNVQEKIPVKTLFSEKYIGQFVTQR